MEKKIDILQTYGSNMLSGRKCRTAMTLIRITPKGCVGE